MALDASTLASRLADVLTKRRWRRIIPFWTELLDELFTHMQDEFELVNYDKAWDNFDKDDLNLHTFTVLTIVGSGTTLTNVGAASDEIVLQNTGAGAGIGFATVLPASPFTGQRVIVKDTSGNAFTRNITVSGNGNNIDGGGNFLMNANYEVLRLIFDGSNWFII